ncbi:MAG: hypothetical protein COB53_08530 [Elusimicrobia bacterium]|nr:MAG: hypothetical protein COB53_08530 [Elusimicrobiota bacterium]
MAAAAAPQAGIIEFDAADYPRHTVDFALEAEPCSKNGIKDVLFSSELRWQGAKRKSSSGRIRLLRQWTKHIGDIEAAARYGEERSFVEGGNVYWAVAPEGLIPYLEMDLRPGDKLIIYFVFVGCEGGRPLFAIEEYAEPEHYDAIDEQDVVI